MKKFSAIICVFCLLFVTTKSDVFMIKAATKDNFTYRISNGAAVITSYDGNETNIVIPATIDNYSVKQIGDNAFSYDTKIQSVVISEGIERIGEAAFNSCRNLRSVTIPASLQTSGNYPFQNTSISEVHISDMSSWCQMFWGMNVVGGGPLCGGTGNLYLNNELITKLVIPEGVAGIGCEAFFGCNSIVSVVLPDTLEYISNGAFTYCDNIKDVWYVGSEEQKNDISMSHAGSAIKNANWHYNSCPVGAPHSYDNDCDDSCNGCGKSRTVAGHSYENTCDTTCNICNEPRTITHTYDNVCDTECNICKSTRTVSHNYGVWTISKKATCIDGGTKIRKCDICFHTETAVIASLGHDFSDQWTIDKEATCTVAGSKSHHCSRCSEISCSTTIAVKGHSWGEWVVKKQATKQKEGLSVRKCKDCGLEESQTIAKLAADGHTHKFGEWELKQPASCLSKGQAVRLCSICKEAETKDLLATGHQVGEWVEVSATCTQDGARQRSCVVCGEIEKITIKSLGHDFENPVITKEPTDTEAGIKQGKCKRCGEQTTEEIPALSVESTDLTSETNGTEEKQQTPNNNRSGNSWVIWVILVAGAAIVAISSLLIVKKKRQG